MQIIWKGTVIGILAKPVPDMYYLEGKFEVLVDTPFS